MNAPALILPNQAHHHVLRPEQERAFGAFDQAIVSALARSAEHDRRALEAVGKMGGGR